MSGLGNFLQGAAGGALGGSAFGPGGALIGGIGGGLLGFLGGDGDARQKALEAEIAQKQAAQGDYSDFRQNQRNYIGQLEAMFAGRGPSLAGEQLKAATDRNVKQQMGMAQSGVGNPAAAMMAAQNNTAMLGAQASQDAAQARIQEQLNAANLLGINLHSAREADEGMNRFNASQQNQFNTENYRTRAMLMGQPGASNAQAIMAGGAGMFGQGMQMRMLRQMQQKQNPTAGGIPGVSPWNDRNISTGKF